MQGCRWFAHAVPPSGKVVGGDRGRISGCAQGTDGGKFGLTTSPSSNSPLGIWGEHRERPWKRIPDIQNNHKKKKRFCAQKLSANYVSPTA